MATFIVTGGCGFIGSHLVDALISRGDMVHIIDDLSTGKQQYLNSKAILHEGSILNHDLLKEVFKNSFDGCFHIAAISSVEKSNKEWSATHLVNCFGSVSIFEAAVSQKIPIIYASSAAVYGSNTNFPLSEYERPCPLTAYGVDKYAVEMHGLIANSIYGVSTIGFRFFNVYGPRQDPTSPYSGVISTFIRQALEGVPFTINGTGQQTRDFVYVQDVVNALIEAMTVTLKGKKGAEVFNVCTGIGTNLLELTAYLEEIKGSAVGYVYRPERRGDIQSSLGNPSKLKDQLSVIASMPLKKGLRITMESIEKERVQVDAS